MNSFSVFNKQNALYNTLNVLNLFYNIVAIFPACGRRGGIMSIQYTSDVVVEGGDDASLPASLFFFRRHISLYPKITIVK